MNLHNSQLWMKCAKCGEYREVPANRADGNTCLKCGGGPLIPMGYTEAANKMKGKDETLNYCKDQEYGKILFECDGLACKECSKECSHTKDVKHAVNFHLEGGYFVEGHPRSEKSAF